jgi:hypothetical protein
LQASSRKEREREKRGDERGRGGGDIREKRERERKESSKQERSAQRYSTVVPRCGLTGDSTIYGTRRRQVVVCG